MASQDPFLVRGPKHQTWRAPHGVFPQEAHEPPLLGLRAAHRAPHGPPQLCWPAPSTPNDQWPSKMFSPAGSSASPFSSLLGPGGCPPGGPASVHGSQASSNTCKRLPLSGARSTSHPTDGVFDPGHVDSEIGVKGL